MLWGFFASFVTGIRSFQRGSREKMAVVCFSMTRVLPGAAGGKLQLPGERWQAGVGAGRQDEQWGGWGSLVRLSNVTPSAVTRTQSKQQTVLTWCWVFTGKQNCRPGHSKCRQASWAPWWLFDGITFHTFWVTTCQLPCHLPFRVVWHSHIWALVRQRDNAWWGILWDPTREGVWCRECP